MWTPNFPWLEALMILPVWDTHTCNCSSLEAEAREITNLKPKWLATFVRSRIPWNILVGLGSKILNNNDKIIMVIMRRRMMVMISKNELGALPNYALIEHPVSASVTLSLKLPLVYWKPHDPWLPNTQCNQFIQEPHKLYLNLHIKSEWALLTIILIAITVSANILSCQDPWKCFPTIFCFYHSSLYYQFTTQKLTASLKL